MRLVLVIIFTWSLALVSCFDTTPPEFSSRNFTISKFDIYSGYRPTGAIFTAIGDLKFNDYFIQLSPSIKMASTKPLGLNCAYALDPVSRINDTIDFIHVYSYTGSYNSRGNNALFDDIIEVELANSTFNLESFNSLARNKRAAVATPIKFYFVDPPEVRSKVTFKVEISLNNKINTFYSPEIWLNP